jgi:hypothetical protein
LSALAQAGCKHGLTPSPDRQHVSAGGIVRRGIDKPLLIVLALLGGLAVVMVVRGFPLSAAAAVGAGAVALSLAHGLGARVWLQASAALICAVVAAGAAYDPPNSLSYRFRLTVHVLDAGVEKSGSSVFDIRRERFLGNEREVPGWNVLVDGDALPIALDDSALLLVTLGGADDRALWDLPVAAFNGSRDMERDIALFNRSLGRKAPLPPGGLTPVVYVPDRHDPGRAFFAGDAGAGRDLRIMDATIEITRDPVDHAALARLLPELAAKAASGACGHATDVFRPTGVALVAAGYFPLATETLFSKCLGTVRLSP